MYTFNPVGIANIQNKFKLVQPNFLKSLKMYVVQFFHPGKRKSSKKSLKAMMIDNHVYVNF